MRISVGELWFVGWEDGKAKLEKKLSKEVLGPVLPTPSLLPSHACIALLHLHHMSVAQGWKLCEGTIPFVRAKWRKDHWRRQVLLVWRVCREREGTWA
jgi:hypothetical protein